MSPRIALIAYALVNAYLLGVLVMYQRVDYPLFGAVSRAEFPAYYAAFTSKIPLPVVLWEFVALLAAVPLVWYRPDGVPAWSVSASLAAGVVYMVITFAWHLPVHKTLGTGDNSPAVLRVLLSSNLARTIVQAGKCVLAGWMIARAS